MGTGKTKIYYSTIVLNQRRQEERYNMDMETRGESDIRFYPSLILTPVNAICQTWKEGHENFKNLDIFVYYSTPSEFPERKARVVDNNKCISLLNQFADSTHDPKVFQTPLLGIMNLTSSTEWPRRRYFNLPNMVQPRRFEERATICLQGWQSPGIGHETTNEG